MACFFAKKTPFYLLTCSLFLLFLPSCQFGKPYEPPLIEIPDAWKTEYRQDENQFRLNPEVWKTDLTTCCEEQSDSIYLNDNQTTEEISQECTAEQIWNKPCDKNIENWWEIFNDPILNHLEEQALESNYSLWAALEKVTQAYALARVNSSLRWPTIGFNPSFVRSGMLIENPIIGTDPSAGTDLRKQGLANLLAAQRARDSIPQEIRFNNTAYTLPFNFSYEVDLWGKLTNAYHAATFRADAAYEAYLSVLLSLTTDVAINYFQLRGLDTQQLVLQKNIGVRQQALDISQSRFQAGLTVYSDVTRAQEQLASAKADSADVARQRGLQENILALLTSIPAPLFSLDFNPFDFNSLPPIIPTGIPADVLYRRPDIAQAERNLAAAHADIGVAYAAFYPDLRLSATLGLESPFLSSLFTWKARLWEIGANIMQSVFTAGRNSANLLYYIGRYREVLNNYQGQVLIAFKDVEDALINLKQRAEQAHELQVAVKSAEQTLSLSRSRYTQGLVNYLEVVDAERNVLGAELNASYVLAQRYLSTVLLIKALGGGWQSFDCQQIKEDNDLDSFTLESFVEPPQEQEYNTYEESLMN